MRRHYYADMIEHFLAKSEAEILGALTSNSDFSVEITQRQAWKFQIQILRDVLKSFEGAVFLEYAIPRMGRRIDAVVIINNVVFVLEFKVGEKDYLRTAIDQVWDYALDLKNFHETSQHHLVAPILVATEASSAFFAIEATPQRDQLLFPIKSNCASLGDVISSVLKFADGEAIDVARWSAGKYSPTPTIIEAAIALYNHHSVA